MALTIKMIKKKFKKSQISALQIFLMAEILIFIFITIAMSSSMNQRIKGDYLAQNIDSLQLSLHADAILASPFDTSIKYPANKNYFYYFEENKISVFMNEIEKDSRTYFFIPSKPYTKQIFEGKNMVLMYKLGETFLVSAEFIEKPPFEIPSAQTKCDWNEKKIFIDAGEHNSLYATALSIQLKFPENSFLRKQDQILWEISEKIAEINKEDYDFVLSLQISENPEEKFFIKTKPDLKNKKLAAIIGNKLNDFFKEKNPDLELTPEMILEGREDILNSKAENAVIIFFGGQQSEHFKLISDAKNRGEISDLIYGAMEEYCR